MNGKRKFTTRAKLADGILEARNKARQTHNQTFDLGSHSQEQANLCHAFLDLNPDRELIERLKAEKSRQSVNVRETFDQLMEVKRATAGDSLHHVIFLQTRCGACVKKFGSLQLSEIAPGQIDTWLSDSEWAPRTRQNVRASVITMFRWARDQGFSPEGKTTAEKTTIPIVMRFAPSTITPGELATMLDKVRPQYLPWLALSAHAGIRLEDRLPQKPCDLFGHCGYALSSPILRFIQSNRPPRFIDPHYRLADFYFADTRNIHRNVGFNRLNGDHHGIYIFNFEFERFLSGNQRRIGLVRAPPR